MASSSLFCFHKRTAFRKRLILFVTGSVSKPLFKTVDELVDFYCQKIQRNADNKNEAKDLEYQSSSSDDSEKNDYLIQHSTPSEKFLRDHNSPFYIEEVLKVQSSPHFSF